MVIIGELAGRLETHMKRNNKLINQVKESDKKMQIIKKIFS